MIVPDITQFEQEHHLDFRDKSLLQRAFIHRSYLNEASSSGDASGLEDNERLEFLGDAVLSYIVSKELFLRFPTYQEGKLTSIRSALVQRDTLALLATNLRLGDYLWLGRGEEDSGGRSRPATLCAAFEALVGAVYMDQGAEGVSRFILPLMQAELDRIIEHALEKDPKSRLQEFVQSTMNVTPRYRPIESSGPDHAKTFVMKVVVDGKMVGVGRGRKKQDATQAAAAMALNHYAQYAPEYTQDGELEERYGLHGNSASENTDSPPASD
jgi:ribonuclease III